MNASNPQDFKCPLCHTPADREQGTRFADIKCPRCGRFLVNILEGLFPPVTSNDHTARLSGWVREQNAAGNVPIVTPDILERTAKMSLPLYRERALKALKVIARKYPNLADWGSLIEAEHDLEVIGTSYSAGNDEAEVLLHVLSSEGLLDLHPEGYSFRLTVPGLLAVEAMSAPSSVSARGFVAMDFAENMREAWTNGFDPGIRAAGFQPVRIDAKDYVGGITDEIMSEIRQSRFVVADYTGQKSGVYFEAGFGGCPGRC
jgi:hypothetical protein